MSRHTRLHRSIFLGILALAALGLTGCGHRQFRVVHSIGAVDARCPHAPPRSVHCAGSYCAPSYPGHTIWRPLMASCAGPAGVVQAGAVIVDPAPESPEEIPPGAPTAPYHEESDAGEWPGQLDVRAASPLAEQQPVPPEALGEHADPGSASDGMPPTASDGMPPAGGESAPVGSGGENNGGPTPADAPAKPLPQADQFEGLRKIQ